MASNDLHLDETWTVLSRYGQKFSVMQAFSDEMNLLIAKKRQELKDAGYDVDSYYEEYEKLNQECSEKISTAKNIWERDKISLEYNKKMNALAKQYLDIDLKLVTNNDFV